MPLNSLRIVSKMTPLVHSQVTGIIYMQEIINYSTATYVQVRKLKIAGYVLIATHLVQNWCRNLIQVDTP